MIYTIQHGTESHTTGDLPASVTLEQIKSQSADRWPEVANSTIQTSRQADGSTLVTFALAQGNKA